MSGPAAARSASGRGAPTRGGLRRASASRLDSLQRAIQGAGKSPMICGRGGRRRSQHHIGACGQGIDPLGHQSPQTPGHPMPDHGVADRLGHHEAHARRCGGLVPPCVAVESVHHQDTLGGPPRWAPGASPEGCAEVLRTGQPMSSRKQESSERPGWMLGGDLRPRGSSGPCGAAKTGSSAPRGCACATGNREPWPCDACWAERCACS